MAFHYFSTSEFLNLNPIVTFPVNPAVALVVVVVVVAIVVVVVGGCVVDWDGEGASGLTQVSQPLNEKNCPFLNRMIGDVMIMKMIMNHHPALSFADFGGNLLFDVVRKSPKTPEIFSQFQTVNLLLPKVVQIL